MKLFQLLCTAAGNLNDAIELGEPRAAQLCIDDMREMLDTIEAEHLPLRIKLVAEPPVVRVKKGQHDAHVRARRGLIGRIVERAYDRRVCHGLSRKEVVECAANGLASLSAKPWPNWHAPGQKNVPAAIVHEAMCAGFLPRTHRGTSRVGSTCKVTGCTNSARSALAMCETCAAGARRQARRESARTGGAVAR